MIKFKLVVKYTDLEIESEKVAISFGSTHSEDDDAINEIIRNMVKPSAIEHANHDNIRVNEYGYSIED